MERTVRPGEFYKHFKGKMYQIVAVAKHSETKESMVVYQALYDDFSVYVRPYDMFLSEVDHVKYPEVTQKYRFEQVFFDKPMMAEAKTVDNTLSAEPVEAVKLEDNEPNNPSETDEVDPRVLTFLEAETYQDKLNVITGLKDRVDDAFITVCGMAIDVEIPEGDLNSRYLSLKNCLMAHIKYEGNRLR